MVRLRLSYLPLLARQIEGAHWRSHVLLRKDPIVQLCKIWGSEKVLGVTPIIPRYSEWSYESKGSEYYVVPCC